jgi:hypothetical protein
VNFPSGQLVRQGLERLPDRSRVEQTEKRESELRPKKRLTNVGQPSRLAPAGVRQPNEVRRDALLTVDQRSGLLWGARAFWSLSNIPDSRRRNSNAGNYRTYRNRCRLIFPKTDLASFFSSLCVVRP